MTDQAAPTPEPNFDRAQTGWLTRSGERLNTIEDVYRHFEQKQAERTAPDQ